MQYKYIIEDYLNGISINNILHRYSISKPSLYKILKDNNIECNRRIRYTEQDREKLIEQYEAGVEIKDIKNHIGKKIGTYIYKEIEKNNRRQNVSDNTKKAIKLVRNYRSNKDVANMFNVSPALVSKLNKERKV